MKYLTLNQLNEVSGGVVPANLSPCELLRQELLQVVQSANDVANSADATLTSANAFADRINALLEKYKY